MIDKNIIRVVNRLFDKIDKLYNDTETQNLCNKIISRVESNLSENKNYFKPEFAANRKELAQNVVSGLVTNSGDFFDFCHAEFNSPFGIFKELLDEDIPDLAISNIMIKIQMNVKTFINISVPDNIIDGFTYFLEHFVTNQKFIEGAKLGVANAIIDCNYDVYRFNIVHESLSLYKSSIVTVRKHIQNSKKKEDFDVAKYEKSLGVPKEYIDILKLMKDSSICVFGEPGSGKTTILKHLIMFQFDTKRNVCVIEDTPELEIPTNISLVTNAHNKIKDLFKAALRQNPSHLIIGETRTDEIVDIMESGLTFNIATTIHATSITRAHERIYLMSRVRQFSKDDISDLICASINIFIHMKSRSVGGIWIRNSNTKGDSLSRYDTIEEFIKSPNYNNLMREIVAEQNNLYDQNRISKDENIVENLLTTDGYEIDMTGLSFPGKSKGAVATKSESKPTERPKINIGGLKNKLKLGGK